MSSMTGAFGIHVVDGKGSAQCEKVGLLAIAYGINVVVMPSGYL